MVKTEHKMYAYLWDTLCSTSNFWLLKLKYCNSLAPVSFGNNVYHLLRLIIENSSLYTQNALGWMPEDLSDD